MQSHAITVVARSGYAARGVVYLIVGGLAVMGAFGGAGRAVGSKGALVTLAGGVWGQCTLVVIALGLFAYALWRGAQALLDADGHGTDMKGLVIRAALMVSAVTHFLLGAYALSLPFTIGWSSGDSGRDGAIAWLMQKPFGVYVIGIAGLCVVGAGVAQLCKGITGKYRKRLALRRDLLNTLSPICAFGLTARGVVFMIMGGFIVYAAYSYDPDQAGGLAEALEWLRQQKYGQTLFVAVAAGLFAFGVYSLIEAAWREVEPGPALRTAF